MRGIQVDVGDEHFDTPESAIDGLLPHVPLNWTIWECTDTYGRSGIASGFRKHGYTVESTNFDFLAVNGATGFDCIITNPPFHKKDQFIDKCLSYGKPFALLLPLEALGGIKRHELWGSVQSSFGLIVNAQRIQYAGGSAPFNTSWFTVGMCHGVLFYNNRRTFT